MPVSVEVHEPDGAGSAHDLVETAVRAVLEDRGVTQAEVSVTLLDDAAMAALNRQWKGKDGPTDVLAFPLYGAGEPVVGDIYVGRDQTLRQARELGEPPGRELARVAIHATLHVLGWDHAEEGREQDEMWQHQERILDTLGIE